MLKKVSLASLGLAMQTYGDKLAEQQEVLCFISDMLMDTYASETVVLRAARANTSGERTSELQADAARVFVNDAATRVDVCARATLAAMTEGDALRTNLAAVRQLLKLVPGNTVAIRRTLADQAVEQAGYIF